MLKLRNKEKTELGIGLKRDDDYDNVAVSTTGTAECSSKADNNVNLPMRMLEPSDVPWISMPGIEEVTCTVKLPKPEMVQRI